MVTYKSNLALFFLLFTSLFFSTTSSVFSQSATASNDSLERSTSSKKKQQARRRQQNQKSGQNPQSKSSSRENSGNSESGLARGDLSGTDSVSSINRSTKKSDQSPVPPLSEAEKSKSKPRASTSNKLQASNKQSSQSQGKKKKRKRRRRKKVPVLAQRPIPGEIPFDLEGALSDEGATLAKKDLSPEEKKEARIRKRLAKKEAKELRRNIRGKSYALSFSTLQVYTQREGMMRFTGNYNADKGLFSPYIELVAQLPKRGGYNAHLGIGTQIEIFEFGDKKVALEGVDARRVRVQIYGSGLVGIGFSSVPTYKPISYQITPGLGVKTIFSAFKRLDFSFELEGSLAISNRESAVDITPDYGLNFGFVF